MLRVTYLMFGWIKMEIVGMLESLTRIYCLAYCSLI